MEVKFGKDGSAQRVVDVQEVNTAADADAVAGEFPDEGAPRRYMPVVRPPAAPQAVATRPRDDRSRVDTSDDAISLGEIRLPALNIVQGVGDLMKTFDQGSFVFDQKLALTKPPAKGKLGSETTPPLQILVIGFRPTRWAEKVAGGARGRIVNSEDNVYAVGGSTDYKSTHDGAGNLTGAYFERLATALILIRAPDQIIKDLEKEPDQLAELFPYEVAPDPAKPTETQRFALAQWHLRGSAHSGAAVPLKTARKLTFLKAGYTSRIIEVTCTLKPFGKNSAYVPIVRPGAHATEAHRSTAAEILASLTDS